VLRRKKAAEPPPESPGAGLRQRLLDTRADELALREAEIGPVWGVVMDTGLDDGGWFTLVTVADGTTSLYTSGTYGVIGAGEHPAVRHAAEGLRATVAGSLDLFAATPGSDLPPPGSVTIRALTFAGSRTVTAGEDDLAHGRHPAAGAFHAAHAVITQVRLLDQQPPPAP
jgi:hypothetical protein